MTRANPPPRGCLVQALAVIDGDNWARWALLHHPGLLAYVRWQAEGCEECARTLARLFPEGLPECKERSGKLTRDELLEVFRSVREEMGKGREPPA